MIISKCLKVEEQIAACKHILILCSQKEQAELRKLEERRALEEKRWKQQETREMYDRSLQMKRKKQAKEMQEQLAFDMKILEQLLEETKTEAKEQAQRKVCGKWMWAVS